MHIPTQRTPTSTCTACPSNPRMCLCACTITFPTRSRTPVWSRSMLYTSTIAASLRMVYSHWTCVAASGRRVCPLGWCMWLLALCICPHVRHTSPLTPCNFPLTLCVPLISPCFFSPEQWFCTSQAYLRTPPRTHLGIWTGQEFRSHSHAEGHHNQSIGPKTSFS